MSTKNYVIFTLFCLLTIALGFYPACRAINTANEEAAEAHDAKFELRSYSEVMADYNQLREATESEPQDLRTFVHLFEKAVRLQEEASVMRRKQLNSNLRDPRYATSVGRIIPDLINMPRWLEANYSAKFSPAELNQARQQYGTLDIDDILYDTDYTGTGWLLIRGYLLSVAVTALLLFVRALRHGFSPILLLCDRWYYAACMVFPMGILGYPNGNPTRKLADVARWIIFLLSSGLGAFAPGMALASPQKLDKKDDEDNKLVWVFEDCQANGSLWSRYLGADGAIFHDGPVLNLNGSCDLPAGFILGVTQQFSLDDLDPSGNKGDETDILLAWSRDSGKWNVGVEALYIDVQPLARWDGNVIDPAVSVSREIWSSGPESLGLSAVFRMPFPVNGKSPENGTLTFFGVGHSRTGEQISFTQSLDFLHDDGAFGFEPANLLVHQWRLSRGRWFLTGKISAPLTALPDSDGRGVEFVAGVGLVLF